MSWLKNYKAKFDEEEAVKKAAEKKEKEKIDSLHASAVSQLKSFVKNDLKEIIGKKTKDGKKISVKWNAKYDNQVQLLAGREPFLELYFSVGEHTENDSEGCKWGNGEYYIEKAVKLCRRFECKSRYEKGGPDSRLETMYYENVAEYLLKFIDI